jgi:sulfide dehydrogenase cytochrome subunit
VQVAAGEVNPAVVSVPCAGCHGTDGASEGQAATIAGLSKTYLKDTMLNYKNDKRYSTIMGRIAKGYSDEQIEAMADYFSAKPWVSAKVETDPEMVSLGRQLHTSKGCIGCHGSTGISPMPTAPRMAGQYPEYLKIQMQYYADPSKPIPPTAMPMRGMLSGLSDEYLTALAHFYASQK